MQSRGIHFLWRKESGERNSRSEKFPAHQWLATLKSAKLGLAPLGLKHALFGRSARQVARRKFFKATTLFIFTPPLARPCLLLESELRSRRPAGSLFLCASSVSMYAFIRQYLRMNILMLTNAYTPLVGGLTSSVRRWKESLEELGHTVKIVAPSYDVMPEEEGVIRVPSWKNVMNTPYSLPFPFVALTLKSLHGFVPDVIHVHHPFLLGTAGLRLASTRHIPIVYTYHTRIEHYMHYVKGSQMVAGSVQQTIAQFASLCDAVVVPSASMVPLLEEMGVQAPISVIPTAVDTAVFEKRDGRRFRGAQNIPADAFLVGFVSRLAPEKNPLFLMRSICLFLKRQPGAYAAIAGDGPERTSMERIARRHGVQDRMRFTGTLTGTELADAYDAFSVFAFASKSETQGIVLAEALQTGTPIVALHATGSSDVVHHGRNGFLIKQESKESFAEGLARVALLSPNIYEKFRRASFQEGEHFAPSLCAHKLASL